MALVNTSHCVAVYVSIILTVGLAGAHPRHVQIISGGSGPPVPPGSLSPRPTPISAAWFRDRRSLEEWNKTLTEFQAFGGDTIILRAPEMRIRSRGDILSDPDYFWCGEGVREDGRPLKHCVTAAEEELTAQGLNIISWATFDYQENYGDSFLRCPGYERKINGSRIYHRLVLKTSTSNSMTSDPCDLAKGTPVMVLLTSFAGVDPHELVLQAARGRNMSVYLALPGVPGGLPGANKTVSPAYYNLVDRYLSDHQARYNKTIGDTGNTDTKLYYQQPTSSRNVKATLYDVIAGYFLSNDVSLPDVTSQSEFWNTMSVMIHRYKKEFGVNSYALLNTQWGNHSIDDHVRGVSELRISEVDILAVEEGRGQGRTAAYFDTEDDTQIKQKDSNLWQILSNSGLHVHDNTTYGDVYTGSIQELMRRIAEEMSRGSEPPPTLWLSVGGVENLPGDSCLPLDRGLSGRGRLMRRASVTRVLQAMSAGADSVRRVVAQAWDPDFTCGTEQFPSPLSRQLPAKQGSIIASCGWHSPQNMSIVIIGFNLAGLTQAYTIKYHTSDNKLHTEEQHGYYFELDYGKSHGLEDSLQYSQLYDLYYIYQIKPHGSIHITAGVSNQVCIFSY